MLKATLLKATLSLDVFPVCNIVFGNKMCVLFPPSKTKSITCHKLLINLPCGSAVYKLKSYVATDLAELN